MCLVSECSHFIPVISLLYPSVIQCILLSLWVCILHLTDMLYSAGENIWHLDCDGGVGRASSHDSSKSSPVPENDMSATTTKRKYIWDMLCTIQSMLCVTPCYLQHVCVPSPESVFLEFCCGAILNASVLLFWLYWLLQTTIGTCYCAVIWMLWLRKVTKWC